MADLNDEFDEIFGDMGGGAQTPAAPAVRNLNFIYDSISKFEISLD